MSFIGSNKENVDKWLRNIKSQQDAGGLDFYREAAINYGVGSSLTLEKKFKNSELSPKTSCSITRDLILIDRL